MIKKNCWEFKDCGREPEGRNVEQLGTCPAAEDLAADGLNGGTNAGRICWAVSGHFSEGGATRCSTAKDLVTCMACEFFKSVIREEGIYNITFVKPGGVGENGVLDSSSPGPAELNRHLNSAATPNRPGR